MASDPIPDGLKAMADAARQVMTLAAGIVTLTITFADKFKPAEAKLLEVPWQLKWAWILYGASVFFGIWTLLTISGSLSSPDHPNAQKGVMGWNVRLPSYGMVLGFAVALGFTIAAGFSIVR